MQTKLAKSVAKLKEPLFVARPLMPSLTEFMNQLKPVWKSAWLSNFGNQHKMLEAKLQKYLGVEHLSLVNNGTLGLMVAIKALGLTGQVITTPFTFPATAHALSILGLEPVFADVMPDSGVIDPAAIEKLITKKTTAILAVHVYGFPCDVKAIEKIARKHKLKVIYDAAHAFGVKIDGKPIGTFGDVTMFSFHPTKLFHTGEGGALAVKNKKLLREIYLWKNFGIADEETVLLPGINAKMNEIQAALGLVVFRHIPAEIKHRKQLYTIYKKGLEKVPGVTFLTMPQGVTPSYQYAVIKIDPQLFGRTRDSLHTQLIAKNFFTRKYFYPLCSSFPHYATLRSAQPGRLPVATNLSNTVLSLPFHSKVTSVLANQLVAAIQELGTNAKS